MTAPILATKLYIPPAAATVVPRSRLVDRLNQGLNRKLTLISAPAGFGKTTLIRDWANCCGQDVPENAGRHPAGIAPPRQTAWLSLDGEDSHPARFLAYLVAALQTAVPGVGEEVLRSVQPAQPFALEPVLIALLNDITKISGKIILVLDDYHVIDSKAVDEAMSYLIEHLPPQIHLVITTREDPQLPLARLRARGQLTELRAADLRFTPLEAAEFLQGMGIHLTQADIAALDQRTEGWIAGLQLAALALQDGQNIPGFLREFAGDHRYIMDYLVEEVLQRQPEPVRDFLLQTSILDRLHGPLCDAVTGRSDSSTRLQALEHGNFFVVPLDEQRRWYRYHHLFADVLQAHLTAEHPDWAAGLHRRASGWYEQHAAMPEAIRHALAAQEFARAADMIERVFPAMSRSRQEVLLLAWLDAIPEALVRERPVLCNWYAGALMQTGEMEKVEDWLLAAEHWLAAMDVPEQPEAAAQAMLIADPVELCRLPGAVAIHRAGQALMFGKVGDAIQHARQALALAPKDDYLRRGGAAALQALAFWTLGDLEAACRMYPESMMNLRRAGYHSDATGCALALADIVITLGRLHGAMAVYQQALRLASEHGEPNLRGTADMLVGMSELHYEHNDLPAAVQYLESVKGQGEHTGLPQNRYRWRVVMARIRMAQGDLDGALELLDAAERLYTGDFSPNVRPIAAMKARLWAVQGRLEDALAWIREQQLDPADELSYTREYAHITLARIYLASFQGGRGDRFLQDALSLLDRLLVAAEAGGRVKSVIEIRMLQSLALYTNGDAQAALAPLQQAMLLAEPEGFVRVFLDEGAPVELLLREASARQISPAFSGRLLAAFEAARPHRRAAEAQSTERIFFSPALRPSEDILVEPLSQRELELLRLLRTELSGPEIARELMVALSTVRTHTKSIYGKLHVNSRAAAVRRAAEMNLI